MKKIIFLKICCLLFFLTEKTAAQQLKRATISTQGGSKTNTIYRVSHTSGGCLGCGTLQKNGVGFLRQGFQQPPDINNNPAGCLITASFNVISTPSVSCGSKFDFEFTGASITGVALRWDFGAGANPRFSSEVNPTGVTYSTAGIKPVVVNIQQGACRESAVRIVNVSQNQTSVGGNLTITDVKCRGAATGSIRLEAQGGTGVKNIRWSNGSTAPNLTNINAGNYQVTITDANNCAVTIDTVVKQPNARLDFTDSTTAETCKGYNDGSIFIAAKGGTSPFRYQWENGRTEAQLDSMGAGKYRVRILDSNNCQLDTAVTVRSRCRENKEGQIYNTFTPNGDGINDTWVVNTIEKFPNNELFIYNRWGQVVYSKLGYANDWEGTNNEGELLPTSAYYYVIKLNDDKQTIWTGSVTIVR